MDFEDELERTRQELIRGVARWPFTRSELQSPEKCSEKDQFIAMGWDEDEFGRPRRFRVRRDCSVVGYRGDDDPQVDFDSLVHPETAEDADEWRDVYVQHDGTFGGWVVHER